MRNNDSSKIRKIISLAEKLPYFNFADLIPIETNKTYLKILFSRYEKKERLVRLKKGFYTTKEYVDQSQKSNIFSSYLEFLANILYQPSYLSLDYILYKHNLLTEMPVNFTSMTLKKTNKFSNKFGNFFYHKIKENLFFGFEIIKEGDFTILKATKAKALFDFLYLRKNSLINKKTVEELRLNLDNFDKLDLKEFKKYSQLEGSKKMKEIFNWLWKQ
jgi:predicted transcriptional regulator of viral defense system